MMPTPRWRRGKRRAVSPIIATILLVAITVVLAAVLYILISGLGSTGSKPYQIGFGQGTPSQAGTAPAITYFDSFSVSTTSGLTTSLFGLKITNATGTPVAGAAASTGCTAVGVAVTTCTAGLTGGHFWYAVLEDTSGNIAAIYAPASATPWTSPTAVTLNSALTVVIVSSYQIAGTSAVLSAFGTGSSSVSGSATM